MECTNVKISLMPQEVFDMIADHLDWSDLISMSMAFVGFNNQVSNSKSFLSRTKFSLTNKNQKENILRKYSHIYVESVNLLVLRKLLVDISGTLRTLKLSGIRIVNKLDLSNFLDSLSLSRLQDLEFDNLNIVDETSSFPSDYNLNLPFLTNLTITSADEEKPSSGMEWFLDHIGNITKLNSLKIGRGKKFNGKSDALFKFFNKLNELECLDLTFVDLEILSSTAFKVNSKLQLKELKLKDMPFGSMNLHMFLELMFQAGTKLTIIGDCNRNLVTGLIHLRHNALEYFSFDILNLDDEHQLNFNKIKTLIVSGENPEFSVAEKLLQRRFFKQFKRATELKIPTLILSNLKIDQVGVTFPSVEKLTVDLISGNFQPYEDQGIHMELPRLSMLEITQFQFKQLKILNNFVKCHDLSEVRVHVPQQGFIECGYGNIIFKALHAVINMAKKFEIFDGKTTHRKSSDEISIAQYGKILNKSERKRAAKNYVRFTLDDEELVEFDRKYNNPETWPYYDFMTIADPDCDLEEMMMRRRGFI